MTQEVEEVPVSFETDHQDLIHDVQMDYYGKLLATASSDKMVKIFEISGNDQRIIANLEGHNGPVWRVSWANPRHGRVLASCGYDRQVIIWKQNKNNGKWQKWYSDTKYDSSVNCVSFLPNDISTTQLTLITGDADGNITIYTFNMKTSKWERVNRFLAHKGGVTCISWSLPINIVKQLNNDNVNPKKELQCKFVSGGCDNEVKIWEYNLHTNKYLQSNKQTMKHNDWIRDVAWAPIPGASTFNVIASCSEDKKVIIWKQMNNGKWSNKAIPFKNKVWSLCWSELGNILAIANGENNIQMYKETLDGSWKDIANIE